MYICITWSNFQIKFHSYENASAYIPNKLEQFSLRSNPLPNPIHKNKKTWETAPFPYIRCSSVSGESSIHIRLKLLNFYLPRIL